MPDDLMISGNRILDLVAFFQILGETQDMRRGRAGRA